MFHLLRVAPRSILIMNCDQCAFLNCVVFLCFWSLSDPQCIVWNLLQHRFQIGSDAKTRISCKIDVFSRQESIRSNESQSPSELWAMWTPHGRMVPALRFAVQKGDKSNAEWLHGLSHKPADSGWWTANKMNSKSCKPWNGSIICSLRVPGFSQKSLTNLTVGNVWKCKDTDECRQSRLSRKKGFGMSAIWGSTLWQLLAWAFLAWRRNSDQQWMSLLVRIWKNLSNSAVFAAQVVLSSFCKKDVLTLWRICSV